MKKSDSVEWKCRTWQVVTRVVVVWLATGVLAGSAVFAQSSFMTSSLSREDRRETGLKIGHGRLHGALSVLGSYDTNALYADVNPESDYVLQLVPGADFEWRSSRLSFNTGYRFTYRDNVKQNTQDNKAHDAHLKTAYVLSRRFSFLVEDRFSLTSDPATVEIPERLERTTNQASGEVIYKTPAEDLDVALRYTHFYQNYGSTFSALSFFNNKVNVTSRVNIASHFRFLPKSIASGTVELSQTDFQNDPASGGTNNDSRGANGSLGLSSQFTRKVSFSVNAGVATIQASSGPSTTSATGQCSAKYSPTGNLNVTGGYERSFQVSTVTNYYEDHRFHLDASWKMARRITSQIRSTYDILNFSGPDTTSSGESRQDFVIQLSAGVGYAFADWGKLNLEYQFDDRNSNSSDPITGAPSADFMKHRANVGLELYY